MKVINLPQSERQPQAESRRLIERVDVRRNAECRERLVPSLQFAFDLLSFLALDFVVFKPY